jgi:hypothetical protein
MADKQALIPGVVPDDVTPIKEIKHSMSSRIQHLQSVGVRLGRHARTLEKINPFEKSQDKQHYNYRGIKTNTTIGNGLPFVDGEKMRNISRDLYCIVLPVDKSGPFKTKEEVDNYRQILVNDLVSAGLDVTLFYSTQEDEIFIKVGADDARLLAEADHIEYVLELDPTAMKTIAESEKGLPERQPIHLEAPFDRKQRIQHLDLLGHWQDMPDPDVTAYISHSTHLSPFEQLHARYNDEWEKYGKTVFGVQIYKVYKSGTLLRMADRMKLVQIIMERSRAPDLASGAKGAGVNLQEMVLKKKALAVFPLQNALNSAETGECTVDELFNKWNRLMKFPWDQPIDDIRDYFGEKIALYFAFLGHYTYWLASAAFLGFLVFIHQLADINYGTGNINFFDVSRLQNVTDLEVNKTRLEVVVFSEVPTAAFFAIFISLWASFMIEFWKRKQSRLALRWGRSFLFLFPLESSHRKTFPRNVDV